MPRKKLRGFAQPVLVRPPLFIRLCHAFVDNLSLILKTALVFGALLFARNFEFLADNLHNRPADADFPRTADSRTVAPSEALDDGAPVITDRVRHYLNCTYEEYRRLHFNECVESPSSIYQPPAIDPDDQGHDSRTLPIRYAGVTAPASNSAGS